LDTLLLCTEYVLWSHQNKNEQNNDPDHSHTHIPAQREASSYIVVVLHVYIHRQLKKIC